MISLFSGSIFSDYLYYLIPFIFTFALVFGVLAISNAFKNQKNVNAMIAIAIALFATIYPPYTKILYNWLPYLCILFIVIFVISMLKDLFVKSEKSQDKSENSQQSWPVLITIAILFLVFMFIYPSIPLPNSSLISSQDILLIIGLAFIAIIMIVGSKVKLDTSENKSEK